MKTFNIEYKAEGNVTLNADTAAEAVSKFEDMSKQDLINNTDEFSIMDVEQVWEDDD